VDLPLPGEHWRATDHSGADGPVQAYWPGSFTAWLGGERVAVGSFSAVIVA
jgi:hypothetical protein